MIKKKSQTFTKVSALYELRSSLCDIEERIEKRSDNKSALARSKREFELLKSGNTIFSELLKKENNVFAWRTFQKQRKPTLLDEVRF